MSTQGEDFTQNLTKKVGPLPVWMYAVILAAVILIYRHFKTPKIPAPTAQDLPYYTGAAATSLPATIPTNTPSIIPDYQPLTPLPDTQPPVSPQTWVDQASAYLNQTTPYSSDHINQALDNYMTQTTQQTTQLQTIIDHALNAVPAPLIPIPATFTPAPWHYDYPMPTSQPEAAPYVAPYLAPISTPAQYGGIPAGSTTGTPHGAYRGN